MNAILRFLWFWCRLGLGVACLFAAAYLVVPPLLLPNSSNAVINAWIVPVRSSFEGCVTRPPPPVGTLVSPGEFVARVENPWASRRTLVALEAERATLTDSLAALESEKSQLLALQERLQQNLAAYRSLAAEHLAATRLGAEAEIQNAQANVDYFDVELQISTSLAETRLATVQEVRERQLQTAVWDGKLKVANAALERCDHSRLALDHDVFLEWGVDSPHSRRLADQLVVEIEERSRMIAETRSKREQIAVQIEAEKEEWERAHVQEIVTPVRGVVWRNLTPDVSHADKYSELLQILSSEKIFVEAVLTRQEYDLVEVGDPVEIRLYRRPFFQLTGSVTHKLGSGADMEDRLVAADVVTTSEYEFRVYVRLDRLPPGAAAENFYHVGQRVSVRFLTVRPERWFGRHD